MFLACLKDDARDVLTVVPAIAARIPLKAKALDAQELSNILWASANLKDDAPDVLTIVPAIAAQIPLKAKDLVAQALSNILWASANLQAKNIAKKRAFSWLCSWLAWRMMHVTYWPLCLPLQPGSLSKQRPWMHKSSPTFCGHRPTWRMMHLTFWPLCLPSQPRSLSKQRTWLGSALQHFVGIGQLASQEHSEETSLFLAMFLACLKDDARDVLTVVPAIAARIPLKTKDMTPQHLSDILWASANLKDDAPDVLTIVPAIAAQIPLKAKVMNMQELSNSLIALLNLQDLVPEPRYLLGISGGSDDFLRLAISRTQTLIPNTSGKDLIRALPGILWVSARSKPSLPAVRGLLGFVAERLGSKTQLSMLTGWGLCVLHESCKVLDPSEEFKTFEEKVKIEITRRELSASDVERGFQGPLQWGRGKKWKVLPQGSVWCALLDHELDQWQIWPFFGRSICLARKEFDDSWCPSRSFLELVSMIRWCPRLVVEKLNDSWSHAPWLAWRARLWTFFSWLNDTQIYCGSQPDPVALSSHSW